MFQESFSFMSRLVISILWAVWSDRPSLISTITNVWWSLYWPNSCANSMEYLPNLPEQLMAHNLHSWLHGICNKSSWNQSSGERVHMIIKHEEYGMLIAVTLAGTYRSRVYCHGRWHFKLNVRRYAMHDSDLLYSWFRLFQRHFVPAFVKSKWDVRYSFL